MSGRRGCRRGERYIGGRLFILGGAQEYFKCLDEPGTEQTESLEREVAGARRHWEMVRVIKSDRRGRVYIYVFGRKDEPS